MSSRDTLIFTDGSSRGNPGPGGWGAIVAFADEVAEIGGREERTTNNRMELMAAIEGLALAEMARGGGTATVFSDSSYVINGITKWVPGWEKNGWQTKEKGTVLNRDLWERLATLNRNVRPVWKRVAGHAGHDANERCDRIATSFADGEATTLYRGPRVLYRILLSVPTGAEVKRGAARTGKAYSYVSAVNGEVRVHATWADCERRVKGATRARYRKALSADEERALVAEFSK